MRTLEGQGASSLYVHVPLCASKCAYCDFFSLPRPRWPQLDSYLEALEAGIARHGGILLPLETLYIGGGTPSLLGSSGIARIIRQAEKTAGFLAGAEITLEANPSCITKDFLAAAYDAGVTRLSLGIQSLCNEALLAVSRAYGAENPAALSRQALETAATHWQGILSVDLIAGLPKETPESFAAGLAAVTSYKPHHLSLYALSLEPDTPLFRAIRAGAIPWDEEAAWDLWLSGRDRLESLGWPQYEVSNFAQKGFQCRHNLAYWGLKSYAGVGAGAVGTLIFADTPTLGARDICALRYTGAKDIAAWIAGQENAVTIERLDKETLAFETLMMGFRTLEGVSAKEFRARFGESLEDRIGAEKGVFSRWQNAGLALRRETPSGPRYSLTREGLLRLNTFLADSLL